uniref:Uncharacterized protein LOC114334395 n=1 Tax=Diabrotica virgifera virgifera TaxID=50390 RepID=A0A6P7G6T6_DIAVI
MGYCFTDEQENVRIYCSDKETVLENCNKRCTNADNYLEGIIPMQKTFPSEQHARDESEMSYASSVAASLPDEIQDLLDFSSDDSIADPNFVPAQDEKYDSFAADRNKCKEKIKDEVRLQLFKEFWEMGSYNRRLEYIAALMDVKEKSSMRIRCSDPSKQR